MPVFNPSRVTHKLYPSLSVVADFLSEFVMRSKGNQQVRLSIDLETTGLDPLLGEITIIGMSYDGQEVLLVHPNNLPVSLFNQIMADPQLTKVMHNAKFDMKWLMTKFGTEFENTDCTQIMRRMRVTGIQGAKADLATCAATYFGIDMDKSVREQFIGQTTINAEMAQYAALDVAVTWELWQELHFMVIEQDLVECYTLIEKPLIPIVAHMELDGIDVDLEFLKKLQDLLERKVTRFQAELNDLVRQYGAMPMKERKLLVKEKARIAVDTGKPAPDTVWEEVAFLNVNSSQQVVSMLQSVGFTVTSSSKEVLEEPTYTPTSLNTAFARLRKFHDINKHKEIQLGPNSGLSPTISYEHQTPEQRLATLKAMLAKAKGVEPEPVYEAPKIWRDDMVVEDVLEAGYDIIQRVLDLRQASKALNGFVIPLQTTHVHPVTGKIHTSLNQLDTSTGRFSNKEPNFQQMPSKRKKGVFDGLTFRRAFVPPAGFSMLVIDYEACEGRILAELTQDKNFMAAVQHSDLHAANAAIMFGFTVEEILAEHAECEKTGQTSMRQKAKTGIFTLVYGGGARRVAAVLKCTIAQAQQIIDTIFQKFPGIKRWIDQKKAGALRDGFVISLGGRKRYFDRPKQPDYVEGGKVFNYEAAIRNYRGAVASIERQAQNAPVQATNADITKYAMILVAAAIKPFGGRLILTIHDELIAVCPTENAEACYAAMEKAMVMAEEEFLITVGGRVDGKISDHWSH